MLLFFGVLWAALSARPAPATISDGALLLDLDGTIVEQPAEVDPFTVASGQPVSRQYRLRDLVRAIDAATDRPGVRRAGVECVSTSRSRGSTDNYKKTNIKKNN